MQPAGDVFASQVILICSLGGEPLLNTGGITGTRNAHTGCPTPAGAGAYLHMINSVFLQKLCCTDKEPRAD